ncbi:MAG: alpha/beta hydrolase [Acholeplasmatales bacterium]|nr:alpha/beta hydrolase [Acholeplasmatales bacterium]
MNYVRVCLKILMFFLVFMFGVNFIQERICYMSFTQKSKMDDPVVEPEFIQMNEKLTGYGYRLDSDSEQVIIFFGGNYNIAYNVVGKNASIFNCTFISPDYYGSQDSKGHMNLKTMKKTAVDVYDYIKSTYPDKTIYVIGHSYGTGMATYLASVREVEKLFVVSGFRDNADIYNRTTPIFYGPLKVFISNNIKTIDYAKNVECKAFIMGSRSDFTLSVGMQEKLRDAYPNGELKLFENVEHSNYFKDDEVIDFMLDEIGLEPIEETTDSEE